MNCAESLVRTLLAGGVDVCFANPGTSEMHFVAALDKVAGMRSILVLFEGVATGAAVHPVTTAGSLRMLSACVNERIWISYAVLATGRSMST